MLQTLNPYSSMAKTAQIMARYRPIAPRPQTALTSNGDAEGSGSSATSMSPTIRQSPYLRNVWPHLQSRPTRTRKRGRTSLGPPSTAFKRPRTLLQGLSPPSFTSQGFVPLPLHPTPTTLVTLPLLQRMQPPTVIDLNTVATDIPEEKDLLAQLQKPTTNVISPSPIRLIPSTISIRAIKESFHISQVSKKKAEEIEKELESQVLPAFVSDSNNQVRLVNSAYKELIGQPDCLWLESIVACKTICGEVVLNFTDLDQDAMVSSGGFSCWARIEWAINGKRNSVDAFGEAARLACESKDYKFAWRFHIREASEPADSKVY